MYPEAYITRRELKESGEEIKELWRGLLMAFLLSHPAAARAIATVFRERLKTPKPETTALAPAILMIDGDPVSSETFASALIEAGFEVVCIADFGEALALHETESAVVIVDETLPESGELCTRIRQKSDIPVILLGTSSLDKGWERAASLGADAYLKRTTSKTEFVARVKTLLRRYRQDETHRGRR